MYISEEGKLVNFYDLKQMAEYLKNYLDIPVRNNQISENLSENEITIQNVLEEVQISLIPQCDREELKTGIQKTEPTLILFDALEKSLKEENLAEAIQSKQKLSATIRSPITGQTMEVRHLIDNHLFRIHNKELHPEQRKHSIEDLEYGQKAFADPEATTNEERVRAITCARVEVLLAALQLAINTSDKIHIDECLKVLEEIDLHPNDSAEDLKNITHKLHEQMYFTCLKAKEENHELMEGIDLHESCFEGKFGAHAFNEKSFIPFMTEPLELTIEALKKIWN